MNNGIIEGIQREIKECEANLESMRAKLVELEKPKKVLSLVVTNSDSDLDIGYSEAGKSYHAIIGYISDDGGCRILGSNTTCDRFEALKAEGFEVSGETVRWRGGKYQLRKESGILFLVRTDIVSGYIYNFTWCHPVRNCEDTNILRHSNGTPRML